MSTAHAHEIEQGIEHAPAHERKPARRSMPPGPMAVRGVPGRLLARLWERAPWSRGPEVFVWPSPDLLMGELGLSRTAYYRAAKILEGSWTTRTTKRVRGHAKPVKGWVLHLEEKAGPLFERVQRPEDVAAAEVLLDTYGEDGRGTEESRRAGQSDPEKRDTHPLRNRTDQNSTSARTRATDEEEVAGRTPPPPPRPRPRPDDEPLPAAQSESVERALWDAAEQERCAGTDELPRPCDDLRRASARRLLEHIQRNDRCDEPTAHATATTVLRARAAYARRKQAEGVTRYAATYRSDPFSITAYEHVVAHERAKPAARTAEQAANAWRAREYVPPPDPWAAERRPLYLPDPVPASTSDLTSQDIGDMADLFLASIRPVDP